MAALDALVGWLADPAPTPWGTSDRASGAAAPAHTNLRLKNHFRHFVSETICRPKTVFDVLSDAAAPA